MKNHDENNVYAFDSSRTPVHISVVEKGKRGYHCIGCGTEMIAKKGPIQQHHFAHAPRTYLEKNRCSYSDETYRHKLAKEILQRVKEIKVPAVYAFSSDRSRALKVADSKTVKAFKVRNEIQFYEDINGVIRWGRNNIDETIKEKDLLIQPDVTFFDKNDVPILLIENVVTHKVDKNKLTKIQRLGIDTISVKIPKESPLAIELNFKSVVNTEWLHNNIEVEERYTSFPVSSNDIEGIPSDAEFQRKVFESKESVSCRTAQLKDLIRGIKKCLGSEQYRRIESEINSRLFKVQENASNLQRKLQDHREKCERKFQNENAEFIEELENSRVKFSKSQDRFKKESRDLEERYYRKRGELDEASKSYRYAREGRISEIRTELKEFRGTSKTAEEMESDFRSEFELQGQSIDRIIKETRSLESKITQTESESEGDRARVLQSYEDKIERRRIEIRGEEENFRIEIGERSKRIIEKISNESFDGIPGTARKYFGKASYRRLLLDIKQGQDSLVRLRKIKKALDQGEWETKPTQ